MQMMRGRGWAMRVMRGRGWAMRGSLQKPGTSQTCLQEFQMSVYPLSKKHISSCKGTAAALK